MRVQLRDVLLVDSGAEDRGVHDLDVDVARLVGRELNRHAEIDDPANAVLSKRAPACVRQLPDVVGADDRAMLRTSAVLSGETTEIANIETAVPGE